MGDDKFNATISWVMIEWCITATGNSNGDNDEYPSIFDVGVYYFQTNPQRQQMILAICWGHNQSVFSTKFLT